MDGIDNFMFFPLHMQYDRINRLRKAADLFLLQIIEPNSWVGIVTFESTAKIVTGLRQIVNYHVQKTLANNLPTTAGGGTSICSGVRAGFQVKENIFQLLLFCCILRKFESKPN